MTAIQIADSFDSFAIDHTPDGWPAVQQKQLTEAAAELRRLEAQLQKETAARQAAQIEAEALKERLVRADAEKCAAVLAERIAPKAPVQEQQPAPASKPVLLQCLGCERVGTQEQLSASTDCDCWLHTQLAPVQEPVAWASQTALDIAAEGGEGIIVGAEADCLIPLYTVPQPVPVQEPVAEVKVKMTGSNAGIATVIHEIYDPLREPLQSGSRDKGWAVAKSLQTQVNILLPVVEAAADNDDEYGIGPKARKALEALAAHKET